MNDIDGTHDLSWSAAHIEGADLNTRMGRPRQDLIGEIPALRQILLAILLTTSFSTLRSPTRMSLR
ncbi:MAG: hypothetical protein CK529_09615 [Rhodospirillaceae bacterium]|nr:MAG: hypothetical protein CK529_09615 [Rhodospirillaceae bacterium]